MSKSRFINVTSLDPGRFRYNVTFLEEVVIIEEDGSQIVSYSTLLTTKAIREPVTRRFNVMGDITFQAGATLMNNYWYFTIRFRSGFVPLKDMLLIVENNVYTITSMPELDEPPNYWKMLCVKTDRQITT